MTEEGKLARPYIWRLISLVLLFTPSVLPLWYGRVRAASTAARSFSRPRVKVCRWGRSSACAEVIHVLSRTALPSTGSSSAVDEVGQSGHLMAGGAGGFDTFPLVVLEAVRAGEKEAGQAPGRKCGPVGLDTPLVDVADQQVRAARVAQLPDFPQEMGDGDGRILQSASA